MTLKTEELEAALIEDVCSRVHEKLADDEAARVEEFVRQYCRRLPPEDVIDRSELDVYGAALAHWNSCAGGRPARRRCASTTRSSSSTAGSQRTRLSRW